MWIDGWCNGEYGWFNREYGWGWMGGVMVNMGGVIVNMGGTEGWCNGEYGWSNGEYGCTSYTIYIYTLFNHSYGNYMYYMVNDEVLLHSNRQCCDLLRSDFNFY